MQNNVNFTRLIQAIVITVGLGIPTFFLRRTLFGNRQGLFPSNPSPLTYVFFERRHNFRSPFTSQPVSVYHNYLAAKVLWRNPVARLGGTAFIDRSLAERTMDNNLRRGLVNNQNLAGTGEIWLQPRRVGTTTSLIEM